MCLNQAAPGQLRGDLVRMCSCRGPHAGFVHIRCLVKNAEERGEHDVETYHEALYTCTQCRQDFTGAVKVALARAAWLHFAGRAEEDKWRQATFGHLGCALGDGQRDDESFVIFEEHVAVMRRLHCPNDLRTIRAEELLAIALLRVDEAEKLRRALETLTRTYSVKVRFLGGDHADTLFTATHLAAAQRLLGMYSEAAVLQRRRLAATRRLRGENHLDTLEAHYQLAVTLAEQKENEEARNEARGIVNRIMPVAQRVLGPDHHLTSYFRLWSQDLG